MRSWTLRLAYGCLVVIGTSLHPATAFAQVARVEMHTFASTTLTDQQFLTGKKEGKPVVLAGELRIPKPGTDRLPAVILVHGSGGVSGYVDDWVPKLNALGVVTFVFDSFTPRGIVNTNNDQSQLGRLAMIEDAYRALALLSKHPRVDPDRIALMGFSRGGQATLYASLKRFQRMHGPAGASYALYIAFYPACGTTFLNDDEVADRPVRIFHGAADDYVPIGPCRTYVERLRRAGKDVRLTEYPGAFHVFDWAALKTPMKLPQAQTMRRCRVEEAKEGLLVNAETKQPFTYDDPCIERGVTLAYNEEAHDDAIKAVAGLVNTVLKGEVTRVGTPSR
jgi:dienelactone hydrolase